MARDEHDREDLLAEATALVERIELKSAGEPDSIVVGFRRNGAASCFFGADPVYQFNAEGRLRRAFVEQQLYKAEHGRVVELRRERTDEQTVLWRRDLTDAEQQEFLERAGTRLLALRDRLRSGEPSVVRQVPADVNVLGHVRQWLATLALPLSVADSPRAAG